MSDTTSAAEPDTTEEEAVEPQPGADRVPEWLVRKPASLPAAVGLAAGCALLLLGCVLPVGASRPKGIEPFLYVLIGFTVLFGLATVFSRKYAIVTVIGAVPTVIWTAVAFVNDLTPSVPNYVVPFLIRGPAFTELLFGATVVLITAVVVILTLRRSRRRSARSWAMSGVVVAVVTAGAVAAGALVVTYERAQSSTAPAVEVPGVPGSPTRVAWEWTPPDTVHWVIAAGAGVVVAAGNTVYALDGATGGERWQYRLTRSYAVTVAVTPDGKTVVAQFSATAPGPNNMLDQIVLLDPMTGRRVGGWAVTTIGFGPLDVGQDALLFHDWLDGEAAAISVRTGEPLWDWRIPDDCSTGMGDATPDGVVMAMVCPDMTDTTTEGTRMDLVTLLLDQKTGAEVWRRTDPFVRSTVMPGDGLANTYVVHVDASLDESAIEIDASATTDDRVTPYPTPDPILDTKTGALLYDGSLPRTIVIPDATTPVLGGTVDDDTLVVLDLATGDLHPYAIEDYGDPNRDWAESQSVWTRDGMLSSNLAWTPQSFIAAFPGAVYVKNRPHANVQAAIDIPPPADPKQSPPRALVAAPGAIVLWAPGELIPIRGLA